MWAWALPLPPRFAPDLLNGREKIFKHRARAEVDFAVDLQDRKGKGDAHIVLRKGVRPLFPFPHEMVQLFAQEVMPHFREDAALDETAGVGR